jgi:calcium-dependent protein kinase
MYDKDGSGSISVDEIKDIIGVGKKIPPEIWNQVVQEVDANGDGEVSLDEFKVMMRRLLKS